MNYRHKELANGKWFKMKLVEQMANVGSEVNRAILWREKKDVQYANLAFERALELFDLTARDPKNRNRLKEVLRSREAFGDYFVGSNQYKSTADSWKKYFFNFNYAARLLK